MSKAGDKISKIWKRWRSVKASSGFRKLLTYLIFVVIAGVFWVILALNDSMQADFEVKMNIFNVPDSVHFINEPPQKILVTVRDRGTSLWQNGIIGRPAIDINFRDHAADGVFRISRSALNASIKNEFGDNAVIISASADSLHLEYTTLPGKRVPIIAATDLEAASGKVIVGEPSLNPSYVLVYSTREVLDTLTRVYTERVSRRSMEETEVIKTQIHAPRGARIEPTMTSMKVVVEPLVRKHSTVTIKINNVPEGMDLLLFPSNAEVEYFVPMSDFNSNTEVPEVIVDYADLIPGRKRLPAHLGRHTRKIANVSLMTDSVEYTLVRE